MNPEHVVGFLSLIFVCSFVAGFGLAFGIVGFTQFVAPLVIEIRRKEHHD